MPTTSMRPSPVDPTRRAALEDKYTVPEGRVLLSGIEAIVRTVLDQRRLDRVRGLDTAAFVSGYEGSPLGGLDLEMHRHRSILDGEGIVVSPGVNEELAATAVAGTQLLGELPGRRCDGVAGFWYGKNPGLDRAADAIRHGNYSGTAPLGGAVAWIGDDPTAKSSTIPSSCEAMVKSLLVPLLAPASVAEIRELGLHAVALSRFAGTWAAMKIVADIADGSATVDLTDPAGWVPGPDFSRQWQPSMLIGTQSMVAEEELIGLRLPRALDYAAMASLNRITYEPSRARLGVVASGLAYATVRRALSDLGITEAGLEMLGIRLVKLALVWPLDPTQLVGLLDGLEEVLVIEDKAGFLESQIKEALYRRPHQPLVVGKRDHLGHALIPEHATVTSDLAARVLAARIGDALPEASRLRLEQLDRPERLRIRAAPLPARTPYFCSGCPHNRSTRAGDDTLVGMGIGCHIMAAFDTHGRGRAIGVTQMGGEGAQWNGLFPFTDDAHFVQNLGDGTFFHSGSLAIRAAVNSGADITYKLLYNRAVAMTGGQLPEGSMPIPELTRWLALEGVKRIVVTTPEPGDYRGVTLDPIAEVRHRDDLAQIEAGLADIHGVTVIIYDDRCAAEERRMRKRGRLPTPTMRLWINERVCEGCGDCGRKSTCLSVVPVDTEFGRKTAIHQGSCNHDFSCLNGDCPSFVQVFAKGPAIPQAVPELPVALVDPTPRVDAEDVLIRMPGIGGTGVVTISRIIQMAALLDGSFAAGVDQTGLSQKGGPVISDVRLSTRPIIAGARAGARTADVLLGFDLLGAAAPSNLATADRRRTVAVVNTAEVATAAMVTGTNVAGTVVAGTSGVGATGAGVAAGATGAAGAGAGAGAGATFPERSGVLARIDRQTRSAENVYLDAEWIAERIAHDSQATNMVLTGAAFQNGCLPISAASMEEAIELNGVSVTANVAAFRWGRAAVLDAEAVRRALASPDRRAPWVGRLHRSGRAALGTPATGELGELLDERVGELLGDYDIPDSLRPVLMPRITDLVGYQNIRYARGYLRRVMAVAGSEMAVAGSEMAVAGSEMAVAPAGIPLPVTTAFATGLHKLMAYKDEYEVARLHLDAGERAKLDDTFGPGAHIRVMLHPPLLRALGLRHKISLGRATTPVFEVLYAARRLRGTPFDPFGLARMRRTERVLVTEYCRLVDQAITHLTPTTTAEVAELAALPELIRGYEGVKQAGIDRFRTESAARLDALARKASAVASAG